MKWISVEERLPKMDADVLAFLDKLGSICNTNRKLGVRILKRIEINGDAGWCDGGTADCFWAAEKCVTHWMPLPSPPHD